MRWRNNKNNEKWNIGKFKLKRKEQGIFESLFFKFLHILSYLMYVYVSFGFCFGFSFLFFFSLLQNEYFTHLRLGEFFIYFRRLKMKYLMRVNHDFRIINFICIWDSYGGFSSSMPIHIKNTRSICLFY